MRVIAAVVVALLLLAVLVMPVAVGMLTATPIPTATATAMPTATLMPATPPAPTHTQPRLANATVWVSALHVRACPGVGCAIVGVVVHGDAVVVLDGVAHTPDSATWRRIRAGSLTGWVNTKYLTWRVDNVK